MSLKYKSPGSTTGQLHGLYSNRSASLLYVSVSERASACNRIIDTHILSIHISLLHLTLMIIT